MFYDAVVRQWLRNGSLTTPWPVLAFFLVFYLVLIWRLVRAVRAKLHPEQACAREEKGRAAKTCPPAARPRRSNQLLLKLIPLVLSLLFMGVGGFMIVKFVLDTSRVTAWIETRGKVVSSDVRSHRGSKHTSYSPHVVYTYAVDGISHTGDSYSNLRTSTGNYAAEKAKAAAYRPGNELTVFYNPADPSESVIVRVTSVPFPMLCFFGIFLAVGLMLFVFVVRSIVLGLRPKAERSFFNESLRRSLPRELKHLAFFSVLWNVFVWTILSVLLSELAVSASPVAVVLAIFPLVGLGLVIKLVWGIVSYCRAPRVELTATCPAFREGEQMQVAYELRDGANVVELAVCVVSTNLDLRSGDTLAEDPQGGIEVEVFDIRDAVRMRMGSFAFKIPSMPPARHRSWKLRVTTRNAKGRKNQVEYALC